MKATILVTTVFIVAELILLAGASVSAQTCQYIGSSSFCIGRIPTFLVRP